MEEEFMRQIKCPDCNEKCIKHGVLKSGSVPSEPIDSTAVKMELCLRFLYYLLTIFYVYI